MSLRRLTLPLALLLIALPLSGQARDGKAADPRAQARKQSAQRLAKPAQAAQEDRLAEARLMEVYQLMAAARHTEALERAAAIVQELPHFQLAQLVYGDLLAARARPITTLGDVPPKVLANAGATLGELREESQKRVLAYSSKPRPGTVPAQFLQISRKISHAIAVDASRSRLYLFENRPSGLALVADFYTSVGKAGVSKHAQGDQRTPLGVYYITSNLDPRSLRDFYGSGALPINYPNVLDAKRGKTGSGIWLHGTPPQQFARAPLATDGCLVMANTDLKHLIQTVEVGSTPVVIAPQLQWVEPRSLKTEGRVFESTLEAWRKAKDEGNLDRVMSFYAPDFSTNGKSREQWAQVLRAELAKFQGQRREHKDITLLRWTDAADTMVVTLGEVVQGKRTGQTKRQYWSRQGGEWKIFFEGTL